jgi:hypothetical protein
MKLINFLFALVKDDFYLIWFYGHLHKLDYISGELYRFCHHRNHLKEIVADWWLKRRGSYDSDDIKKIGFE